MQHRKTCRSIIISEAKEQIRPAAYAKLWHYITQIDLYIQNTGYVKIIFFFFLKLLKKCNKSLTVWHLIGYPK